jgi:hypothetical protein
VKVVSGRRWLAVASVAFLAPLANAQTNEATVQGRYHFVQLAFSETERVSVKSVGGTIVFDGRGGYEFTGRGGVGAEGASSAASKGTYSSRGLGRILMDSPTWAGKKMTVQAGDGGAILSGTAADGQHGIFIAVRAPDGDANAATLSGDYGGGYLSFRGGSVGGITTALAEFTSDGAGALSAASLTGHAAWIDDVNRTEKSEKLPYTLRADGTGSIRFAAASDFIAGEREMLVSTGGNYVLGFGTGPGQRDVLGVGFLSAERNVLDFRNLRGELVPIQSE